jgi:hypothetical protein
LLSEYRQTRQKERRLRGQIQHDVANQLVWLAVEQSCETIVFESLGQLDAPETSGSVAWSISSWAQGDLLEHVQYKTGLVETEFETVNPWGTSRYCPRCGERGRTVNAPTDHEECRHGGQFHCQTCGYECDRDVVGAVNVGRKYLSQSKMEGANSAAYMAAENHASFPSSTEDARSSSDSTESVSGGERSDASRALEEFVSSGVQSATESQDEASGRQTHLSQDCSSSLTAKRRETDTGGLYQNHGSNTGQQSPSGSVTRYVLASTTECE